jgi:hypothetical protein
METHGGASETVKPFFVHNHQGHRKLLDLHWGHIIGPYFLLEMESLALVEDAVAIETRTAVDVIADLLHTMRLSLVKHRGLLCDNSGGCVNHECLLAVLL